MIVDTEVPSIIHWLFGGADQGSFTESALWSFLVTAFVLTFVATSIGYLVALCRHGPKRAFRVILDALILAPRDLLAISPQRVFALAMLALREASRRRVWIALIMFGIILMFAGWFLNPDSDEPAVLYLNFVLTATTYLMLPVAVILSAFSLPNDIKHRTIFTVATKPVGASEIVLGRMIGFSLVATILLFIMGISSFVFVSRGLNHEHEIVFHELEQEKNSQGKVDNYHGVTSMDNRHRHNILIDANQFFPEIQFKAVPQQEALLLTRIGRSARDAGLQVGDHVVAVQSDSGAVTSSHEMVRQLGGVAGSNVDLKIRRGELDLDVTVVRATAETYSSSERGHRHRIISTWSPDSELTFTVGPAEGLFNARVPRYGKLRYRDGRGDPKDSTTWTFNDEAINIGKMYALRSYISGNTLAAAIWTFDDIHENDFPNGSLPLDLNIRVYRSHKGDVAEGITGSIIIQNPVTGVRTRERIFTAKEYTTDRFEFPRKQIDSEGKPIDLFRDLVHVDPSTGKRTTEVWIKCLETGQYFGMAQGDVYVRARDAPFWANFVKGFLGIWLQVLLVTSVAVLFSTFLSGPVAMLITVAAIILGFYKGFLTRLAIHVLAPEQMKEVAAHERVFGGGPVEALYRIITQTNLVSKMDEGLSTTIIKTMDRSLMRSVETLLHLIPDFEQFDEVQYLAHGYDIQPDVLMQHTLTTFGFLIAAYVIGYVLLKTRELGK